MGDSQDTPRLKVFFLPQACLKHLFMGLAKIDGVALPFDASIHSLQYEPSRWGFLVLVESSTFEPISESRPIPEIVEYDVIRLVPREVAEESRADRFARALKRFLSAEPLN